MKVNLDSIGNKKILFKELEVGKVFIHSGIEPGHVFLKIETARTGGSPDFMESGGISPICNAVRLSSGYLQYIPTDEYVILPYFAECTIIP